MSSSNQIIFNLQFHHLLISFYRGLGLETVFTNILKAYSDPGQLVIVLGTNDYEETYFIEQLKNQGVKHLPRIVSAQCLSEERYGIHYASTLVNCISFNFYSFFWFREIMYLEGGVLFISGRILVVDLLKNRVPLNLVSGMLVYRAHSILNSHQEAFALRLYRKTNKVYSFYLLQR